MSFGSTRASPPGLVGWLSITSIPVSPTEKLHTLCEAAANMVLQSGTSGLSSLYVVIEVNPSFLQRSRLTLSQAEGVQQAFHLDSLRASHPIEVPVRNALEVDQIFDHISYLKGSSVIRMLSVHLGRETFLRGVADYLKSHAYGKKFELTIRRGSLRLTFPFRQCHY